jgi:hypothetical protein
MEGWDRREENMDEADIFQARRCPNFPESGESETCEMDANVRRQAATRDRRSGAPLCFRHIAPELLRGTFYAVNQRAVSGIDGAGLQRI